MGIFDKKRKGLVVWVLRVFLVGGLGVAMYLGFNFPEMQAREMDKASLDMISALGGYAESVYRTEARYPELGEILQEMEMEKEILVRDKVFYEYEPRCIEYKERDVCYGVRSDKGDVVVYSIPDSEYEKLRCEPLTSIYLWSAETNRKDLYCLDSVPADLMDILAK